MLLALLTSFLEHLAELGKLVDAMAAKPKEPDNQEKASGKGDGSGKVRKTEKWMDRQTDR